MIKSILMYIVAISIILVTFLFSVYVKVQGWSAITGYDPFIIFLIMLLTSSLSVAFCLLCYGLKKINE